MCVGVPGKVVEIKGNKAKIKQEDHYHWVDISLVGDEVKVGDYLVCYQNMAVNKISSQEAKESLEIIEKLSSCSINEQHK